MHAVATALTLRALLEGAIDYAGLFPPASLDLPRTVRCYAQYYRDSESWMLGRFVVPAQRHDELRRLAESIPHSGSWPLS
ncbi:MAG TPA: hypothetical protein VFG50_09130, partial [Rhodothermales bacterium]|nr:hypothetical protein [Rhodothermales bacterium]